MHVEPERVRPERDDQVRGAQPHHAVGTLDCEIHVLAQRIDAHGKGWRLVKGPPAADLDANDVCPDDVDAQQFPVDLRRQPAVGGLDGARTFEPQEVLDVHHVAPFDVRWRTVAVNIADPTEVSANGRGSRQGAGNLRGRQTPTYRIRSLSLRPSTVPMAER